MASAESQQRFVSQKLLESSIPIAQGAEAKVYKAQILDDGPPILLKYRFKKSYRHPSLDTTITKSRVAGEARAILRCLRDGVSVPGIRMVDAPGGVLGLEWIDGSSLRRLIPGSVSEDPDSSPQHAGSELSDYGVSFDEVMNMVGKEIGKMHSADVIHGDLTTSNMMLRMPSTSKRTELVLIDFGLAFVSTLTEDKAVDLYVLERAFSSTHPQSESMFEGVLRAYEETVGPATWKSVKTRLDDVRLRGRKRDMVG